MNRLSRTIRKWYCIDLMHYSHSGKKKSKKWNHQTTYYVAFNSVCNVFIQPYLNSWPILEIPEDKIDGLNHHFLHFTASSSHSWNLHQHKGGAPKKRETWLQDRDLLTVVKSLLMTKVKSSEFLHVVHEGTPLGKRGRRYKWSQFHLGRTEF